MEGTIDCSGGNGGNGGESEWSSAQDAGGAGGAGGGAIYIVHNEPTITNTASLLVNGGTAGTGYNSAVDSMVAGGIGSITIKQYEEGMVA